MGRLMDSRAVGEGRREVEVEVGEDEEGHGRLWRRLTDVKEKIKQMHSKINWIRLVDLIATGATVEIVGVGSLQLERLTVSVDTRSKDCRPQQAVPASQDEAGYAEPCRVEGSHPQHSLHARRQRIDRSLGLRNGQYPRYAAQRATGSARCFDRAQARTA